MPRVPLRSERGSAALEVAIGAPVMLLLVVLVVAGGRVALARQTVTAAADSAARAASISRTAPAATGLARDTARSILAAQAGGLPSPSMSALTHVRSPAHPAHRATSRRPSPATSTSPALGCQASAP